MRLFQYTQLPENNAENIQDESLLLETQAKMKYCANVAALLVMIEAMTEDAWPYINATPDLHKFFLHHSTTIFQQRNIFRRVCHTAGLDEQTI